MTSWEPVSFTGTTLPVRIPQRHCRRTLRSSGMLRRVYATSSSNMDVRTQYPGYSWYLSILGPCITVESPSSNLEASPAKSWHCKVHCVRFMYISGRRLFRHVCKQQASLRRVVWSCMVQTGHGCVCVRARARVFFPCLIGGGADS
jgi:hypothetical protein